MKEIICPICSSPCNRWREKKYQSDVFLIDMCISCGYAFVNPRPAHEYLMQFYSIEGHGAAVKNSREKITYSTVLRNEIDFPNSTIDAKRIIKTIFKIKKKVVNESRFLDVGCGYGFFTREALENGYKVTALELAANERSITKEMTGVDAIATSFEEYQEIEAMYNVILMSQILEHAYDVNEWIEKAKKLMNKNGILVIALPNFMSIFRLFLNEKEPYICPPAHLNYFARKNLRILLEKHGFFIDTIQYVSRVSRKALMKRCFNQPVFVNLCYPIVKLLFAIIDLFHMGMMLNIYAVKK